MLVTFEIRRDGKVLDRFTVKAESVTAAAKAIGNYGKDAEVHLV